MSDYELIYLYLQKCEYAFELLYERYQVCIHIEIYKTMHKFHGYAYKDELEQIAKIKLLQSLLAYRYDYQISFQTFFLRSMNNGFIDFMRKHSRYDSRVDPHIRFEDRVAEDESIYLTNKQYADDSKLLYNKEELLYLCKQLPLLEQKILMYRMMGYTYDQCGKLLHLKKSKVVYLMRKIKQELQQKR